MAQYQVACPFFGLVFTALNSLVYYVQIKELGPLAGLMKELKKLSKTFNKIKEVLDDALEKQFNEEAVQFWLYELNSAAYEAYGVIEEFKYEAIQQLASEGASSRSNNIIEQFHRKIQKLTEIFQKLVGECSELDLQKGKEEKVVIPPDRISCPLLIEPQVYGREKDKEKLVKQLLGLHYFDFDQYGARSSKHFLPRQPLLWQVLPRQPWQVLNSGSSQDNISVFSILGMGGIGKTTLAQLVYNDERVKYHFEVRSWVCVSDHFDIIRLVKEFIASVSGCKCDLEDMVLLQRRLQREVQGKRFLLVLDDVWEERPEEWNELMKFFRSGAQGSSIIVTTRLPTVACITSTLPPHCLSSLSQKDCWALFKQYAFGPGNEEKPTLVNIGKEIVKKCRGSPLQVRILGGSLRFQNEENEWLSIKDSAFWKLQSSLERDVQCMAYIQPNKQDLTSIKGKFDSRVPTEFRKINEYAYTPEITIEELSRPGNRPRWPYLVEEEILGGEGKGARDRWRSFPSRSATLRISKEMGERWMGDPSFSFPPSLVEDVEKQKSVADIQPNKQDLASIKVADIQSNKQDLASIKGKLDSRSPSSSSSAGWCICRVPTKFREVNEYAYTPEIISIGPFHRDKKELKGMEVHKLRYVNSLLSRFEDRATKLEECVEAISRLEDEARKCYSEPIELNKEEFVEMMIVDGLFIIELFRKNAGEGQIDKDDPVFNNVFNNVWGLASLVRDLILLENQLPMLVLERLFNITMASQQGGKRLSELAIRFFNPLMQREETVLAEYFETGGDHLLDILSKTFYDFPSQQLPNGVKSVQVPAPSVLMKREQIVVERAPSQGEISTSSMVKSEPELEFKDVPSLTELRDSGVKFKKGNNTFSFLNINFCNGVIEIPPILIRDQNFSFIRNVIAYEQGLVGHPAQMTSYVVLMNNLIQTSNDVAFLREHGIIINYLSDDELVSSQFQKLHNEINLANFHHSKLCIDVNAFRVTYIQKATSVLKNVYRWVVPTRWVLLAAGLFLTFDAFKLTLATTECTPDLYIFNWQRLDFLSHVLLGIILIVMFWCDSH